VDLDRNYVMTTNPPTFFTPGQRNKFIQRLTAALGGANQATIALAGPARFLREAYPDGKLQPSGPIIVILLRFDPDVGDARTGREHPRS